MSLTWPVQVKAGSLLPWEPDTHCGLGLGTLVSCVRPRGFYVSSTSENLLFWDPLRATLFTPEGIQAYQGESPAHGMRSLGQVLPEWN